MPAARTLVPLLLAALMSYLLAPRGVGANTVEQRDELRAWALWRSGENGGYPTWAVQFLWADGRPPGRAGLTAFAVARRGPYPARLIGLGRLTAEDTAGLASGRAALPARPVLALDLLRGRIVPCELAAYIRPGAALLPGDDAPPAAEARLCGTTLESRDALGADVRALVTLQDSLGP